MDDWPISGQAIPCAPVPSSTAMDVLLVSWGSLRLEETFRLRAPMYKQKNRFPLFLATVLLMLPPAAAEKKKDKAAGETGEIPGTPVLWREPADIASRNLLYGPGGLEHQPPGTLTFVEEDMEGTNPKFVARSEDG